MNPAIYHMSYLQGIVIGLIQGHPSPRRDGQKPSLAPQQ